MAVAPLAAIVAGPLLNQTAAQTAVPRPQVGQSAFAQMLLGGVDRVNTDVMQADKMVRAFAVDDSVPVHQVTFALSQAQNSLELMLQVRNRLVEGYQQLMNMQL